MAENDSKKFYWLKLNKDHFNEYKIRSLMSEKKGDTYTLIYEQLRCECLNYDGVLRYSKERAYKIDELAYVINRPPKLLKETLKVLVEKQLIEIWEDGTIYIFDVKDNVGNVSWQTIRKKRSGNSVVKNTKDLPQDSVIPTLEIRDKRKEKKNIKKNVIDSIPIYDPSNNKIMDAEEENELLTLMGRN